ncbi:hypothetical protein ATANTOWER_025978 [Ataeniobius toweri]|uniref:Uncharacterized protein n=1 Tax=Ataeniobius toweri TaxID=208326 RepID=A0ABU7A844_9TELE|nr:hypothetical protein [Ataeniobius toweri]
MKATQLLLNLWHSVEDPLTSTFPSEAEKCDPSKVGTHSLVRLLKTWDHPSQHDVCCLSSQWNTEETCQPAPQCPKPVSGRVLSIPGTKTLGSFIPTSSTFAKIIDLLSLKCSDSALRKADMVNTFRW